MKKLFLLLSISVCAFGQSQVYGNRTANGGYWDLSGASATRPIKTGTIAQMPSSCNAGDLYFATDAVQGQNLYACAASNTWVQASGGNAAGVNEQSASYTILPSDSGKLIVMNCSSTCTLSMPTSPTNGFYTAVLSIGSTVPTLSLSSKQFNGRTSVPVLIPFVKFSFWSDGTNFFGDAPPAAGSGINFSESSSAFTISSTASGGGVPSGPLSGIPSTCSVGSLYFATDQPANQQLYTCSAANTWTQPMLLGSLGALKMTNGVLDVTSQVPLVGSPNDFTALNTFDLGVAMKAQASGANCSVYINSGDGLLHYVSCSGSDSPLGSGSGSIAIQQNGVSQGNASTINCTSNMTCAISGSTVSISSSGGYTGTPNGVPYVGSNGLLTQSGDLTFNDSSQVMNITARVNVLADHGVYVALDSNGTNASGIQINDTATGKSWYILPAYLSGDDLLFNIGGIDANALVLGQNYNVYIGGPITHSTHAGANLDVMASENGHIYMHGTTPNVTGTGCTAGWGNDNIGSFSTSAAATCTLTFSSQWTAGNHNGCTVTGQNEKITSYSYTASTLSVTTSAADNIDYRCGGVIN